jgi:CheY-like chemotaxis protein
VRLRQILSNLVSNAVKFTVRGSVVLRVLPAAEEGRLRFEVADTGCGVSPEMAERIFDPFTQGDGSTSRKHGGTGLGLAICKNLTTLLDGRIGVQSKVGEGSTFWLELPFRPASLDVPVEPAKLAVKQGPLSLHVLIAEDNVVNQHVLKSHLKKLACTWTMTENGREAVAAARQEQFDAILMDVQMPELDGFGAAREIRALPKPFCDVPIAGVTACAFEEDKERCLQSGMQRVLIKPFTTAELRAVLSGVKKITGSRA